MGTRAQLSVATRPGFTSSTRPIITPRSNLLASSYSANHQHWLLSSVEYAYFHAAKLTPTEPAWYKPGWRRRLGGHRPVSLTWAGLGRSDNKRGGFFWRQGNGLFLPCPGSSRDRLSNGKLDLTLCFWTYTITNNPQSLSWQHTRRPRATKTRLDNGRDSQYAQFPHYAPANPALRQRSPRAPRAVDNKRRALWMDMGDTG